MAMIPSCALLFPGQGSQYPGMGKELHDSFEEARRAFEEASEAVGLDIQQLCFEGAREDLDQTVNTQTVVYTVDMAAFRVFDKYCSIRPAYVAGHSLGEYAALTAAEALPLEEMAPLVLARATFMQNAVPAEQGAMAAVMGLEAVELEELCRAASEDEAPVSPANHNSPGQLVVSGAAEAVNKVVTMAKSRGGRAMKLPISVPCHSGLLNKASERLKERLSDVFFRDCSVPVIPNCDPNLVHRSDTTASLLVRQLTAPVRWQETIEMLVRSGVRTVIELGPKKTLSALAKRIAPELEILNVEDRASLDITLEKLQKPEMQHR